MGGVCDECDGGSFGRLGLEALVMRAWRFVALSFAVGLLSLGEEIVWVRLVSLMLQSRPQAFSLVLFLFILGIAFGAAWAMRLSRRNAAPDGVVAGLLGISAVVVCLSPWLILMGLSRLGLPLLMVLIMAGAGFKGAIFPLVHQYFSTPGRDLGRSLSWVYSANVLGATLGPLVVGFVLLDILPTYTLLFALGICELTLALLFWQATRSRRLIGGVIAASVCVAGVHMSTGLMTQQVAMQHDGVMPTHLIENRHGLIYTLPSAKFGVDQVFGGGVYDGAINIDPRRPINGIERVYLLAALHPQPKRVVVIGLSAGSWLKVLSAFPDVEQIDVVEINPGYVALSQAYDGLSDYLYDARITLHFTDGRRWLTDQARAGRQFDVVLMNTTWHWRMYTSNLLSQEFLRVIEQTLAPNGLVAFNSTGSIDALYTAVQTLPHAYLYENFIYAGNQPLVLSLSHGLKRLCALDFAALNLPDCNDFTMTNALTNALTTSMRDWNAVIAAEPPAYTPEVITDNNMLTEYRRGIGVF